MANEPEPCRFTLTFLSGKLIPLALGQQVIEFQMVDDCTSKPLWPQSFRNHAAIRGQFTISFSFLMS